MGRREPRPPPWLRLRRFEDDERGSFMVLEAILVALLVLTAILFFTSVQRPSTGTDQGGLDLAQVSADTLSILRVRSFNGEPFDTWMTRLALGDSATNCVPTAPTATTCPTALEIQDFLEEVLPTGSRYSLRIDNGVDTLALLPMGSSSEPNGGRASQVTFMPSWSSFASQTAIPTDGVDSAAPDEALTRAAHATLSRFTDPDDIKCIKAPTAGSGTLGRVGPGGAMWVSQWQRTATRLSGTATNAGVVTLSSTAGLEVGMHVQPAPATTGISTSSTITSVDSATQITISGTTTAGDKMLDFIHNRVPAGAFYGTWAGYTDTGCNGGGTFVKVWSPEFRSASGVQLAAGPRTVTCTSACFTTLDVYLPVIGEGIPANARIASVTSPTVAVLSQPPADLSNAQVQRPSYSPYPPYGLQLVVWFGA